MNRLPAKTIESEAVAYAKEEINWLKSNKINVLGKEIGFFDKLDARIFAIHSIKQYAIYHPAQMMYIVECARAGWDLADDALRELITEYLDRREDMPTYLGAYAMEVVSRGPLPRMRGQKRGDAFFRKIAVTVVVAKVAEKFDLTPTGRSPRRASACRVVADALNTSYENVAEIWRQFGEPGLIKPFSNLA